MNRTGRIAIGGTIEMTATKRSEGRAHERQDPDREPEGETDERRDAEPQHEPLQARRGVGPQHDLAGSPVGLERDASDGVGHLADRRQQLVVGIDGAPLRRRDHVDHRDQHEWQERQQQPCRCGWARCS